MSISQVMAKPGVSLRENAFVTSFIQVIAASFFIALCAQISIPLFFTPVPLSLSSFAVLLVGIMLGPKKGAASVMLYIAEGSLGLPVFAGGAFGLANFIGPRGGYLIGFIFQAYLAGWLSKQSKNMSQSKILFGFFSICLLQMLLGVVWLAQFVGWGHVLTMGFYPFLFGEFLKSLAVFRIKTITE
jgi:biotin transport system substrate-specific component